MARSKHMVHGQEQAYVSISKYSNAERVYTDPM